MSNPHILESTHSNDYPALHVFLKLLLLNLPFLDINCKDFLLYLYEIQSFSFKYAIIEVLTNFYLICADIFTYYDILNILTSIFVYIFFFVLFLGWGPEEKMIDFPSRAQLPAQATDYFPRKDP